MFMTNIFIRNSKEPSLASELDTIDPGCIRAEDFGSLARKFQDNELTTPPYEHPYHWAGFTVTGKVPGG
jgi:CHAT domain-containing protein